MAEDPERDEQQEETAPREGGVQEVAPGTPLTQQVGRAVMVVSAILFVIFALANFQYVDFSWIFGETEVVKQGGERVSGGIPLIVLLVIAFGLGILVGTFGAWRRGRRGSRGKRRDERERG